jgi:prepilin-type processing-associated H-X9-DG protein
MRRLHPPRHGFTLRELMVLIAVICFLLTLLPQLLGIGARVESRATTCRSNLRNLGLGIYNYEIARSQYPGYVNDLDPAGSGTPNDRRSALFVTLPYNDHRSLYERLVSTAAPNTYDAMSNLNRTQPDPDLELEITLCPSGPDAPLHPTGNSYVLNTGQLDYPGSPTRPADFAANGVFHKGVADVPGEPIVVQRSSYVAHADGQAMTIMLSESADARSWTDVDERWIGFASHHADGRPGRPGPNPRHPMRINVQVGSSRAPPIGKGPPLPQNPSPGYARPSSFHNGIVNVMFCDGHVRPINGQISYRVFQALMTPDGPRAVNNSLPAAPPFPAGHGAAERRITSDDIP